MNRTTIDRPGRLIFQAGVSLVGFSTILGFYLASNCPDEPLHLDWHLASFDQLEAIRKGAAAQAALASNVHALMWLVFGLGVTLTLYGLRMLTRPNVDFETLQPIGSIREVFENPE
jgi:hypothetical protein